MNTTNAKTPNVVSMIGGLGNQLFQFAFGELLEQHTGTPTQYDLTAFDWYATHGGFALQKAFDVQLARWDGTTGHRVTAPFRSKNVRRIYSRFPLAARLVPRLRSDDDATFFDDSKLAHTPNYYVGTWQWQPFTRKQIGLVTEKLPFRPEVSATVDSARQRLEIDTGSATAIHIRMGDYLSDGKSPHLPLSEAYYTKVMHTLMDGGKASSFVVFSDGISRISGNWFKDLPVTFVESYEGQNGITDLCFLSSFSKMIISASTFGWWAAALSDENPEVFYPDPWVREHTANKPRYRARPLEGWKAVDARGFDLELDASESST